MVTCQVLDLPNRIAQMCPREESEHDREVYGLRARGRYNSVKLAVQTVRLDSHGVGIDVLVGNCNLLLLAIGL
jgi:hypothetical protein